MGLKNTIRGMWSLACLLAAVATSAQVTAPADGTASNPEVTADANADAAVRFRDRTLFVITAPVGTLNTAQRAQAIERRLLAVAAGQPDILESLRVIERSGRSEIYAGGTLIRAVTDQDAASTGRTRRQLAADYHLVIENALKVEFRDRDASHILRGLAITGGMTLALLFSLLGLRRLYRWIQDRITRAAKAWHWKSGLARLKLLSPIAVANAGRSLAAAIAWTAGALLVYFYLEFVLSLFPWTRGFADQMVDAAKRAVVHVFTGLFGYLPSLLNIVVIVFVARFILRVLKGFFDQIAVERLQFSGFHPDWGKPTYSVVRFFVLTIAAVMVFPYLPGSGSEGFKGVSTFVGIAISFGGAPAIANMIAGIIITYMRPFGVGDRVKIADAVGDVTSKNLLVVRLRTIKNVEISIPNSLVLANHIVNFSANAAEAGLILHTTVTIGYDAPWQKVHELLETAARRVEGIKSDPPPFVLQTSLDDFYVAYEINAYTDRPNEQARLYSRLHEEIQNSFSEGGIEILSPHYTAVRDGNAMAVPDEHLPKNYKAPAFNILSRILRTDRGT